MEIKYADGTTKAGPGVEILLTGNEIETAISAYLVAHDVHVQGLSRIIINGFTCGRGRVLVDPSGFVIHDDKRLDGSGPTYCCRAGHKHRSQASATNCSYCKRNATKKKRK